MPEHGHGLIQPDGDEPLGNGDYLVEGLFQMKGWWEVNSSRILLGGIDGRHLILVPTCR